MPSPSVRIRDFSPSDLESVLNIQAASGEVAQWRAADYRRLVREPDGLLLVAEVSAVPEPGADSPRVVGFAAAFLLADEAELRNLAVDQAYRRQGVATALLGELHRRLGESGVERVYLEVRTSNLPALRLYRRSGYVLEGFRHDYYSNPTEDAILLSRSLGR